MNKIIDKLKPIYSPFEKLELPMSNLKSAQTRNTHQRDRNPTDHANAIIIFKNNFKKFI